MEKWWQRFDWTEDLTIDGRKITDPHVRANMLADMFADDAKEFERYHTEILADILRMERRLN
jgi:hypothetical protein